MVPKEAAAYFYVNTRYDQSVNFILIRKLRHETFLEMGEVLQIRQKGDLDVKTCKNVGVFFIPTFALFHTSFSMGLGVISKNDISYNVLTSTTDECQIVMGPIL